VRLSTLPDRPRSVPVRRCFPSLAVIVSGSSEDASPPVEGTRVALTVNGVPVRIRWPIEEPAGDWTRLVCNCRVIPAER